MTIHNIFDATTQSYVYVVSNNFLWI